MQLYKYIKNKIEKILNKYGYYRINKEPIKIEIKKYTPIVLRHNYKISRDELIHYKKEHIIKKCKMEFCNYIQQYIVLQTNNFYPDTIELKLTIINENNN